MIQSEKIEFPGALGHTLAGRLERPALRPSGVALFAHCFTCSKDVFAAQRIATALAERGIAVLRFDFTGLGNSAGDFANTNFSSNVDDLVAAADFLRQRQLVPAIVIGHSLGGAAAPMAAQRIPECRLVATLNAPFEPAHVRRHFAGALEEIQSQGSARVTLAKREFTIRRDFLEDLLAQRPEAALKSLRRAIVIFHAVKDGIVGIENARHIYEAALHPKSFIALDEADHFLSRREDALYVADVIAAWARRHLPSPEAPTFPDLAANEVAVSGIDGERFAHAISAHGHHMLADEPVSAGGADSGPSPYDFLLAGLGACTAMTLRLYAGRKGWPLENVRVRLRHAKIHAADCTECETKAGMIDRIEREVALQGALSEEQRARLMEIADKCPVHRTLTSEIKIETRLARSE